MSSRTQPETQDNDKNLHDGCVCIFKIEPKLNLFLSVIGLIVQLKSMPYWVSIIRIFSRKANSDTRFMLKMHNLRKT